MAEPEVLSYKQHGKLRLKEPADYTAFAKQHLVPVVLQEFYGLACEFPLLFVKNSETGEFVPVALMGLKQGVNLFCQRAPWRSSFVPSHFHTGPLLVSGLAPDSDEAVVCLDPDHPLVSESEGEPMFLPSGDQSEMLQRKVEQITRITRQTLQSRAVCAFLAKKRLFQSRPLKLQVARDAPRYEVDGVYLVDEQRLEQLEDGEFLELRRHGLLPALYAHLTSLQQLGRLARKQHEADLAGGA